MATELGTPGLSPALWGQGLVNLGHPSPLCFAQKQLVGIIVDSSALRVIFSYKTIYDAPETSSWKRKGPHLRR